MRNVWRCEKTQRTMSMTTEAWQAGRAATSASTSRSEVLEILIRHGQETQLDLQEESASSQPNRPTPPTTP